MVRFFFSFPITHPRFNDSHRPEVCNKKNLQRKCSYSEPKSGKRKLLMVTVGSVLFFFLSFFFFLPQFSHEWLLWWWWQQKPQWGSDSCLNCKGGKVLSLTTGVVVPKAWTETPRLSFSILMAIPWFGCSHKNCTGEQEIQSHKPQQSRKSQTITGKKELKKNIL